MAPANWASSSARQASIFGGALLAEAAKGTALSAKAPYPSERLLLTQFPIIVRATAHPGLTR